jgi:hypothetical protein
MADAAFDDLPLYTLEPVAQPRRAPPTKWAAVPPPRAGGGTTTLVMTRVVPLVPSVAVDALTSWFRARQGDPIVFGRSHFELAEPRVNPASYNECRMNVAHHRTLALRPTLLEIELSPWSSALTELDLRPKRWKVSPSESYFAAGHALLDLLERALAGQAARRPVLRPRGAFARG